MAFRTLARDSLRGLATSSASCSSHSAIASSSATSSSATRLFSSTARSNLHHLPDLPARLKEGCMPLLSKSTIEMMWYERQAYLLEKLNDEVRNDEHLGNATLTHTILNTAQKPEDVRAFNYASQALNNAFFLSGIVSPPGISQTAKDDSYQDLPQAQPTQRIALKLEESFGSVNEFMNTFSGAAFGMSGSGYLWLVRDSEKRLGIVPTFGAGTILVQKRQQRGPAGLDQQASRLDLAAAPAADEQSQAESGQQALDSTANRPQTSVSSRGDYGQKVLTPLLCLSVNEHAWLPDWGICGKEEYLRRFWDAVDWHRVDTLCPA